MQVQIVGDHLEKLIRIDAGVEQEGELDVLRFQIIAQAFEHGGLAGAHFARQDDESLARLDAVHQIRQRLFMLFAPVEERRIRAQTERALREAKESIVHSRG